MYFSEEFKVSAIAMHKLGVFNSEIGTDNHMFVDPKLLHEAKDEFAASRTVLSSYFAKTVSLIRLSKKEDDAPWIAACKRMQFKETPNTGIGFSKVGTDGKGIGPVLARRIVAQASKILPYVEFQPDIFELIGVFTEGLGCDRLSDMLVSILLERFVAYTDRITKALGVQHTVEIPFNGRRYTCPRIREDGKPLVLMPREILKPLPIALNIKEALDNADLNEDMRAEVNRVFADAQMNGAEPSKNLLRAIIHANKSSYAEILGGYQRVMGEPYDFDKDPANVSDYVPIAFEIVGTPNVNREGLDSWGRVEACVKDTISSFTKSVEDYRLSDVMYDDAGDPRNEIIAQRLIYCIADIYAKQYDVDVSREANAGAGAVDFRFTRGHDSRLIVEVKLSTHSRLKDGYYEQLPAYGKAEGIKRLILLIIRVSTDDSHIKALIASIELKSLPIDVIVIDAVRKPSASKRRSSL
jgi:hypothetical protein